MRRHPSNSNLHLYDEPTFEGLKVLPGTGPFVYEYLCALKRTINMALDDYPRVLAFRVDLRLPSYFSNHGLAAPTGLISTFLDSLNAKIRYNRRIARTKLKASHDTKVRYVWTREVGDSGYSHYHVLILVNMDAFYTLGRLNSERSNMVSRIIEAWATALDTTHEVAKPAVHVPQNAQYRVLRGKPGADEVISQLFQCGTYLCKARTKRFGDHSHAFGCSRG